MTNYILFGQSGAGKDTVCNIMKSYYLRKYITEPEVIRLSEPVRYIANKLVYIFPTEQARMCDVNLLKSHSEYFDLCEFLESIGVSFKIFDELRFLSIFYKYDIYNGRENRNLLQQIGLLLRKWSCDKENALSEYVKMQIDFTDNYKFIIIPDGRTPEEFTYFKQLGFVSIYIDSNKQEREKRIINRDKNDNTAFIDNELETRTLDVVDLCDYYILNEDMESLNFWVNKYLEVQDEKSKKSR